MRLTSHMPTAALLLVLSLPAAAAAQAPESRGRFSVHPYAGLNSGGWSKAEASPETGRPMRYEFSNGAGAGLRVAFAVVPHVGLWAAGELNVEQEGPFGAWFGGIAGRAMIGPRAGVQARLGAGRLENGPFGLGGATLEWFVIRQLSLGVGADVLLPIGEGRRYNGLQNVPVDYDGGPARLQLELGWYPGRSARIPARHDPSLTRRSPPPARY